MAVSIFAIVIGMVMCFFGYRFFKIWLAAAGFLLGAYLGHYLGGLIGSGAWPVIGAIVVGILLAIISYLLYKIGAVLIGALLGAMLLLVALNALGIEPFWWAALIGAVAGAIIAGVFLQTFIIIGSSYSGSQLTVVGVYALIANKDFLEMHNQQLLSFPWYILVAILALAVVAIVVQMKYKKSHPKHADK